ncbi:uncharacterized protein PFLUO_LOCUS1887 [Penicillium psychrofluorescens]|uniref:uncharacterized protein n=1 Tax=Penicillium psychrofluorescens TaxID=3158075 RepID=UPI003CCCB66C
MDDRRFPPDYLGRYSGSTSCVPEIALTDVPKTPVDPAASTTVPAPGQGPEKELPEAQTPRYDPRRWSLRKKLIVASVVAVVIIVAIVGAIEGVRANRYPDYTPLNYKLVDTYEGPSFFDNFDYFSDEDPTKGFVVYVDEETAEYLNLTFATDTSAVLRVDSSTPYAPDGRNSVRIESKSTYDTGLFIFDILHTPYGCATWPALWLTDGYNWPNNGEIDIVEANNKGTEGNEITLHTTAGCSMDVKRKETGSPHYTSCGNDTHGNSGCGVQGDPSTYGSAFNNLGGGVYALELRDAGVRAWFWTRDSIPADIKNTTGVPNPALWGTALADFPSTDCNIASHFRNQSIIANIDLCGELAAQSQFYEKLYSCPGTCSEFVANNPEEFDKAYWEFKSFKVYQAA